MGSNIFNPVPVPIADGIGASVSVTGQGLKTFVIGGDFDATIIVEIGIGGRFAPIFIVDKPEQFRGVPVVAEDVRVRVVNHRSGQATVFVGGNPAVNQFGALAVPAGNGTGAALDTSVFGADKTLLASGIFDATLTFEVSEDVAGPFAPIGCIDKTSNFLALKIVSRFVRVRVSDFRSGAPVVGIGAADLSGGVVASGGPTSVAFVYQPGGGGTGPVVFADWATLVAALDAQRILGGPAPGGCFGIEFDDTIISPAVIPANGALPPYNMEDVLWTGRDDDFNTFVNIADGASFIGLRRFARNISVTNLNATSPADSSLANGDTIVLDFGALITTTVGGTPLWSGVGVASGQFVFLLMEPFSAINFAGGGPVLDLPVAGSAMLVGGAGSVTFPSTGLTGIVGTLLVITQGNASRLPSVNTGFLGTIIYQAIREPANVLPVPTLAAPSTVVVGALVPGQWARFDASGGAIAQPLAAVLGNTLPVMGTILIVSENGGGIGLTLTPDPGDTIDGSAAAFSVPANGSVTLMNDGISNWEVVSVRGPVVFGRATQSVATFALGLVFAAITGCTVTLPEAGTYRIAFTCRGAVNTAGDFIVAQLFDITGGVAIPDTEVVIGPLTGSLIFSDNQNSSSSEAFITITVPTVINLEARASAVAVGNTIDDVNGRTSLLFQKIG